MALVRTNSHDKLPGINEILKNIIKKHEKICFLVVFFYYITQPPATVKKTSAAAVRTAMSKGGNKHER